MYLKKLLENETDFEYVSLLGIRDLEDFALAPELGLPNEEKLKYRAALLVCKEHVHDLLAEKGIIQVKMHLADERWIRVLAKLLGIPENANIVKQGDGYIIHMASGFDINKANEFGKLFRDEKN